MWIALFRLFVVRMGARLAALACALMILASPLFAAERARARVRTARAERRERAHVAEGEAEAREALDRGKETSAYRLGLEKSEALALQYSYALEAACLGRREASGKRMVAWGNILPQVTGSYGKTYTDTYAQKRLKEERDKWNELYVGKLSVSQPIFSGGKTFADLRRARLYGDSVEETIRQTRQELLYSVRTTYYAILLSQEMVRVSREQVALAEKYLQDVKKRKELETATSYDVLRASVEKTNEQTFLTDYENDLLNTRGAFLKLLGLPLSSKLELTDKLVFEDRPTRSEEALFIRAMALRPDVRDSRLDIKMQRESIKSTRAGLLPQLSFDGYYSGSATDADEQLSKYQKDWQAGFTLSWKIFDGLLIHGQLRELHAQQRQLELMHKDLRDQVRLEIRTALLDIESARTSVLSQQRNVDQASESLRLTQEREKQGVGTHLDVLTARQTLAVAQRNYYQSLHDYKVAWSALALAMGTVGEGDEAPAVRQSGPAGTPAAARKTE